MATRRKKQGKGKQGKKRKKPVIKSLEVKPTQKKDHTSNKKTAGESLSKTKGKEKMEFKLRNKKIVFKTKISTNPKKTSNVKTKKTSSSQPKELPKAPTSYESSKSNATEKSIKELSKKYDTT